MKRDGRVSAPREDLNRAQFVCNLRSESRLKPRRVSNCCGCGLNRRVVTFILCICFGFLFAIQASQAQARIYPSLPEAPVAHQRALFLFPGYDTVQNPNAPVPPLHVDQKFELAYRSIFDLSFPMRTGVTTLYEHSVGVGPFYGPGGQGLAQLYGYNAASLASTFLFTDAVVPALFHQDPRYFRKGTGSARSRIWWALRSELVGFSDRGPQMPNYAALLGFAMSTALSNAYLPARNISAGKSLEGYGIKFCTNYGFNLIHEYRGVARVKQIIQQQTDKLTQQDSPSTP